MVKVYQGTKDEYYMDGILKENMDVAKKVVKKDWDMVFITDGFEGTGKSVLTLQVAKYCDPSFSLGRVVFTPSGFEHAVKHSKQYQSIVYDEAYAGLSARGAMTKINRVIVKMLTECRARNLFIFIVLPTIFELDRYPAIWRSRALFHVYSADNFERGYFAFYNVDRKKSLYMNGKKFYSYNHPDPNFTGRFTNHYPVDKDLYKDKKLKETSKDEESKKDSILVERLHKIIKNLGREGYSQAKIGQIVGVTQQRVSQIINLYQPKPNKLVLPSKNE